jgi:hypothetical protein
LPIRDRAQRRDPATSKDDAIMRKIIVSFGANDIMEFTGVAENLANEIQRRYLEGSLIRMRVEEWNKNSVRIIDLKAVIALEIEDDDETDCDG